MKNKKYNLPLIIVSLSSIGLVWYCSQTAINEVNMLTGNISSVVITKDKPESETGNKPEVKPEPEPEDEFTCQIPSLKVSSMGLYYSPEGDQLGVGPLPPIAGVKTSYWIFWEVSDLNKPLKDFEITAELPNNVVWNNKKNVLAGNLQYGEVTKRVVWTIDEINKDKKTYKVGFEISLVPGEDSIGQAPNLLTNVKYSGIDKECGDKISGSLANINTNLKDDKLGRNKGTVVPFEQ